jgi:hypothetical protein
VPGISYVLALLRLPGLYMASYFVRGVETMSELGISLRRLDAFLSLPEPPPAAHGERSIDKTGEKGGGAQVWHPLELDCQTFPECVLATDQACTRCVWL